VPAATTPFAMLTGLSDCIPSCLHFRVFESAYGKDNLESSRLFTELRDKECYHHCCYAASSGPQTQHKQATFIDAILLGS
jgi:hypothetical protein